MPQSIPALRNTDHLSRLRQEKAQPNSRLANSAKLIPKLGSQGHQATEKTPRDSIIKWAKMDPSVLISVTLISWKAGLDPIAKTSN
jgi:hypothetical protein